MSIEKITSDKYVSFTAPSAVSASEIKNLFNDTNAQVTINENKVSVLLPATVAKGSKTVSVEELAFILSAEKKLLNNEFAAKVGFCCGDENGCCINWK